MKVSERRRGNEAGRRRQVQSPDSGGPGRAGFDSDCVNWDQLEATESEVQIAVMDWAAIAQAKYPELRGLQASANGGSRSFRIDSQGRRYSPEGRRLRREGVKKGVPDLFLPAPRQGSHGLYIELKTATGRVSVEQLEMMQFLDGQGYTVKLCRGAESAIQEIEHHLQLPPWEVRS